MFLQAMAYGNVYPPKSNLVFGKQKPMRNFRPTDLFQFMPQRTSNAHLAAIEKALNIFQLEPLEQVYKCGTRIIPCTSLVNYYEKLLYKNRHDKYYKFHWKKTPTERLKSLKNYVRNTAGETNGFGGKREIPIPQYIVVEDKQIGQQYEMAASHDLTVVTTMEEFIHSWDAANQFISHSGWFIDAFNKDTEKRIPFFLRPYMDAEGDIEPHIALVETFAKVGIALMLQRCPSLFDKKFLHSEDGVYFIANNILLPLDEMPNCKKAFRKHVLAQLLKRNYLGHSAFQLTDMTA